MRKGIGPNGLGASKVAAGTCSCGCGSPAKMGCSKSPMKQTTAGEFAHQKHVKDMEQGKATKPFDKVKAGVRTIASGGGVDDYKSMKKEYRAEAKAEYAAKQKKSPFKQVMSSAEINQALRTKRQKTGTGGIEMDNTLVGLPGVGTVAKAGVRKAAAKTAGKWTGKKTGAIADATLQLHGLTSGK